MKIAWIAAVLALFGTYASADVIDFELQAAGSGSFLTGVPDSPLTIGTATFTGGELRNAEAGLPGDETGVCATEGLFGADSNPLTITFATPVSGFSILIANGDGQNQTYTVSDNLGESVAKQVALAGSLTGSTGTFSLPGSGIRSVSISSANADFWNFAIDDVSFTTTAAPEPGTLGLSGFVLLGLLVVVRKNAPGRGIVAAKNCVRQRA